MTATEFEACMKNVIYSRWPDLEKRLGGQLIKDWYYSLKDRTTQEVERAARNHARHHSTLPTLNMIIGGLPAKEVEAKAEQVEYGVFIQCCEAGQQAQGYFEPIYIMPPTTRFDDDIVHTIAHKTAEVRQALYGGKWIVMSNTTFSNMRELQRTTPVPVESSVANPSTAAGTGLFSEEELVQFAKDDNL